MSSGRSPSAVLVLGAHSSARRQLARTLVEVAPGAELHTLGTDTDRPVPEGPALNGNLLGSGASFHVLDTDGGADPPLWVQALTGHGSGLRISAVVTAVDARLLVPDLLAGETAFSAGLADSEEDPRTLADVLLRQIDFSDHVAVLEDRASPAQVRLCRSLVTHLNPAARVLSGASRADCQALSRGGFDTASALSRLFPAFPPPPPVSTQGDESVESAVWHRSRPLDPQRFFEVLDELTATSLRSRGRLWLAGRADTMVLWEANGTSLSLELGGPWTAALPPGIRHPATGSQPCPAALERYPGTGDRCQHLAFTGLGLDTVRLFRLLDSCLLDHTEAQSWENGGVLPEDPFQPLFAATGEPDH